MKKYLFVLSAFALVFFASCSNDDDNGGEDPSIIATWELTAMSPPVPGWDFSACPDNPEITFNGDGTTTWTLYDSENDCTADSSNGTWEKNEGNNYTVTIPDVGEVDGTVDFSGQNRFTFTTMVQTIPVMFTFQK